MFSKILIANRGEIACRVIKTAKRMQVATVAVYSDADRDARHVREADSAIRIGPAAAADSYLSIEALIDACRQSGADAVHPGYGFLSENAAFASALAAAGIVFIGPPPAAITAMGDKITAKRYAQAAGVNVIPGHGEALKDAAQAVKVAAQIGYPVMLKASAGGGGKGMRMAEDARTCRDGFARATSEAQASFGDARVFIEKYIQQPRHIEIQLLADQHGNIISLNERECSIQRRHQKVIEEAPSPFIDQATRDAMNRQAVALAKAVDYHSAGTVEFVVDAARQFYFLEMNTRLQVEHPVTEMICGLDLVELMLRVAAGEKLPLQQHQVKLDGWAMECRIYAENPYRNFLPSSGRLVKYQPPASTAAAPSTPDSAAPRGRIRVDSGVYEGASVSMFYDPMLAKLITYGANRAEAISTMQQALDQYYLRGIQTNQPFVAAIMTHPRFARGELSTHFIEQEFPNGLADQVASQVVGQVVGEAADHAATPTWLLRIVAVAASVHDRLSRRAATTSGQLPGYVCRRPPQWVVVVGTREFEAHVSGTPGDHCITLDGQQWQLKDHWRAGQAVFNAQINAAACSLQIDRIDNGYRLAHAGRVVSVKVLSARAAALHRLMPVKAARARHAYLLSPMPGLLAALSVKPGQRVKAGEQLAIIEAMKMENTLYAEQDATVVKCLAEQGDTLEAEQPILEFGKE